MEKFIVLTIVLAAAVLLLRLVIKQLKGESDCCSCSQSKNCAEKLKKKKRK